MCVCVCVCVCVLVSSVPEQQKRNSPTESDSSSSSSESAQDSLAGGSAVLFSEEVERQDSRVCASVGTGRQLVVGRGLASSFA